MADSVLSRGISRYQYFLGKWHARLLTVLATYLVMGLLAMVGGHFLLKADLDLMGSLVALITVAALLAAVISCGVTVSAMTNSTVMGIAMLWIILYGGGYRTGTAAEDVLTPNRVLSTLPHIVHDGAYDIQKLSNLMGLSARFQSHWLSSALFLSPGEMSEATPHPCPSHRCR